jgi:uncharacterized membrane protein YgcG
MSLPTSMSRQVMACLLAGALVVSACSKGSDTSATAAPAATDAAARTLKPPPPPTEPPPPPTEDAQAWTPAALDEVLAPIALYPDAILAQVLAASTNAQEVLDAGNWLLENQSLKDAALTKAAADAGFSPAVQALVHFPTVVDMMCRELDWTKQLGDAFGADQAAVLDSVQRLRKQAAEVGNLKTTPEMKVETTAVEGKEVIVVQPANPQVIYVPQYNPTQVYSPPPAAATTTTTTTESSGISTEEAVVGGLLAFTAGVLVGNAFDDDDDDYCYPNWGHGGVYYGGAPYYPHNTFVYAPRYSGYRPANGYRPPANYPARYNNYQRNNNVNVNNVNINSNNNYMNKFDKNQNRVSGYQAKSPAARQSVGATSAPRGSTSYAGAQRPGNAAATTGQAAVRQQAGQPRPSGQYAGASRPSTSQTGTRPSSGQYAGAQRPSASGSASPRPAVPDRGYPQASGKRPDATASSMQRGGEISGGGNMQASRDRAASQRGKSSMSGAPRPSSQSRGSSGGGRSRSGGGRS